MNKEDWYFLNDDQMYYKKYVDKYTFKQLRYRPISNQMAVRKYDKKLISMLKYFVIQFSTKFLSLKYMSVKYIQSIYVFSKFISQVYKSLLVNAFERKSVSWLVAFACCSFE